MNPFPDHKDAPGEVHERNRRFRVLTEQHNQQVLAQEAAPVSWTVKDHQAARNRSPYSCPF